MARRRGGRRERPSTKGMRSCIVCRERGERESLIRLVLSPENVVNVDWYLKAPGRGAHLCYERACIDNACSGALLSRAFRSPVQVPEPAQLQRAVLDSIEGRLKGLLTLGRRARWTVSGSDVITRMAARVRLLILAHDVAPDTRRKLVAALKQNEPRVLVYGDSAWLGETQGAAKRVALAVIDADAARRFADEFDRHNRISVVT